MHFRQDVVLPRRARLRGVLERAVLRQGIGVETAIEMVVDSYSAAFLAGGKPRGAESDGVADAVLAPQLP